MNRARNLRGKGIACAVRSAGVRGKPRGRFQVTLFQGLAKPRTNLLEMIHWRRRACLLVACLLAEASTCKAIFPTLALGKNRLAKLSSRLWRWGSIGLQTYLPDFGAGETSTCKAIFPTLALRNHRPAKLSSRLWRWANSPCKGKAIF